MSLENNEINRLEDLDKLRTAPKLNNEQSKILFNEARNMINKSEWLTIGIMSPTVEKALNAVRKIEDKFEFKKMKYGELPSSDGPIFLKANQKTGEISVRIEYGLGQGILIGCQNHEDSFNSKTIGPFPLDFFD